MPPELAALLANPTIKQRDRKWLLSSWREATGSKPRVP